MTYLILAILSSAAVSLVMRLGVNHVRNNISMLAAGYLSCTILALIHTGIGRASLSPEGLPVTAALALTAGFLLLAGFVMLQLSVKLNGVILSGTFAKLGVLVPTLISVIFFGERPKLIQATGFLLSVAAILLMNSDKNGGKAGSRTVLLFLMLSNGLADSMSKIYEELGRADLQELYLLLSFLFAFLLSLVLVFFKKQRLTPADALYGLLLGIPNYYSARFLIKALGTVPAVVAYPSYSVATILVITAAGILLFREKLSRRQTSAMIIILAALLLLN
ncbi:MAG: EamA family transporter [Candidatus Limivicinus sp.]|jgi:multidrug transporter EmrE-like cation transporter